MQSPVRSGVSTLLVRLFNELPAVWKLATSFKKDFGTSAEATFLKLDARCSFTPSHNTPVKSYEYGNLEQVAPQLGPDHCGKGNGSVSVRTESLAKECGNSLGLRFVHKPSSASSPQS